MTGIWTSGPHLPKNQFYQMNRSSLFRDLLHIFKSRSDVSVQADIMDCPYDTDLDYRTGSIRLRIGCSVDNLLHTTHSIVTSTVWKPFLDTLSCCVSSSSINLNPIKLYERNVTMYERNVTIHVITHVKILHISKKLIMILETYLTLISRVRVHISSDVEINKSHRTK